MNMLDWFRKLAVGDRQGFEFSAPAASDAAQHRDVGGLNFYTSIEAHHPSTLDGQAFGLREGAER